MPMFDLVFVSLITAGFCIFAIGLAWGATTTKERFNSPSK